MQAIRSDHLHNVSGLVRADVPAGKAGPSCGGWAQNTEIRTESKAGIWSHRIPMMQRANQMPAFDSVRISVF